MPIDVKTPGEPGWWLARLLKKLDARRAHYEMLDDYYCGRVDAPVTSNKTIRDAYLRLRRMARTNFAELVVEAVRERMVPVGFRTGAEGDELGDREAWKIWQANQLDADSPLVHRASLSMGMGYVIVGPADDDDLGLPLITPEDPREVIVECDPAHRRTVRAALKVFVDDVEKVQRAYVYLPGEVWRAARQLKSNGVPLASVASNWEWDGDMTELDFSEVPVVPFPNRATLAGGSSAEFEHHLSILDRINYSILSRLEIATLQAFKQRAVKGLPDTDERGEKIDYADVFSADPGALWTLPETAEMWESGAVSLDPIRLAIRDDVQDLAAVTRTPLFYLTPDAANGSAEGASLAREGLVFKTQDRIVQAGEAWEQVMTLAFKYIGDAERAKQGDMEVIWAPPDRHSLAERYDAATKATSAGVPWRTVMSEVLQFSPQQVDRMEAERGADAFITGVAAGGDQPAGVDPAEVKAKADAMGVLIRAGVDTESAAAAVGLEVDFTGATPTSLRLPEEEAAGLEER